MNRHLDSRPRGSWWGARRERSGAEALTAQVCSVAPVLSTAPRIQPPSPSGPCSARLRAPTPTRREVCCRAGPHSIRIHYLPGTCKSYEKLQYRTHVRIRDESLFPRRRQCGQQWVHCAAVNSAWGAGHNMCAEALDALHLPTSTYRGTRGMDLYSY
eukprot:COSAG02_NODE_5905_length_3945_cov_7.102127_5_plen_157_part_00